MIRAKHTIVPTLVAAALLIAGAATAHAAPPDRRGVPADAGDRAKVTVHVVHATKDGDGADGELQRAGLARTLQKTFKDFAGFTLLERHEAVAVQGRTERVTLPNGTDFGLRYKGVVDGFLHIRIDVGGMKSTVEIRDGGMFFQAGRGYDGGMIVIAVRGEVVEGR